MTLSEIISPLSDAALLLLGERDDLAPRMIEAIVVELRARREAREIATRREALAQYWRESVSGSVLADYRAGNVVEIVAS